MSKPTPSHPPKTNPPPNFFSTFSVLIPVPITDAVNALGRGHVYEPVARLSSLCKALELLEQDYVRLPIDGYPDGRRLADVALRTAVAEGTTEADTIDQGALEGPRVTRQHFRMEESVPVLFGLFNSVVRLSGTISWDEAAFCAISSQNEEYGAEAPKQVEALYESVAEWTGIAVWKLRTFQRVAEGGQENTRVWERIEGWAPALMKGIVQRKAEEAHRAHMNLYHTLF